MPSSRYYRFKATSREKKTKRIKFLLLLLFIFISISAVFWLFFISPFFNIRNINISDDATVNRSDALNIISGTAPFGLSKNLLILSKSRLKEKLAAAFPAVTDIVIKKELFHTLIINFQKRITSGIWCRPADDGSQGDKCYYFDKEGVAFANAPETEGSLILKIEDGSKNNVNLGGQVLNKNQINFIITFNDKINTNNKFKILEFKIKPNPSIDFEAVTDKNWLIYLDENQDPATAANNLLTLTKEAIKNTDNLKYVDLRIPNNIFPYCLTKSPCAALAE